LEPLLDAKMLSTFPAARFPSRAEKLTPSPTLMPGIGAIVCALFTDTNSRNSGGDLLA